MYFNHVTKNTFRHLISWAGDLQNATLNAHYAGLTSFDFTDILEGSYGFSKDDLLADMDAFNIAFGAHLESIVLSESIENYYSSICDETIIREEEFTEKVASTSPPNFTGAKEGFAYVALDMLKMTIMHNETDFSPSDAYKYYPMSLNKPFCEYPSQSLRWTMGTSFWY